MGTWECCNCNGSTNNGGVTDDNNIVFCIYKNVMSDNSQVIVNNDHSATLYDGDGVSQSISNYEEWLDTSNLTVLHTLNCFEQICYQVGNVHYINIIGDNIFLDENDTSHSLTFNELAIIGTTDCVEVNCIVIYDETSNPIDTVTSLPSNSPQCTDIPSTWLDSTGVTAFKWDTNSQQWVMRDTSTTVIGNCSAQKFTKVGNSTITLTNVPVSLPIFNNEEINIGSPFSKLSDIRLSSNKEATYVVAHSVHLFENTTRFSFQSAVYKNGVIVNGSKADAYIRDASGDDEGITTSYTLFTVSPGDIIEIKSRRESTASIGPSSLREGSSISLHEIDCK